MPKTGTRINGMPIPRMGKFGCMEKSLPKHRHDHLSRCRFVTTGSHSHSFTKRRRERKENEGKEKIRGVQNPGNAR